MRTILIQYATLASVLQLSCANYYLRTAVLLAAATSIPAQESRSRPIIDLAVTDQPVQLDGEIGEPAWQRAAVIPNLTQQSPQPGADSPFRTEVRLLSDADNLYFAFDCHDPDPSQLAIHTWKRDGDIDGDDYVGVLFDTYGDGRSGYASMSTPRAHGRTV
jgi:hypothetical protein